MKIRAGCTNLTWLVINSFFGLHETILVSKNDLLSSTIKYSNNFGAAGRLQIGH